METLDGCPYYKVVSHLSGNVDFANISYKLEVSVAKSAYGDNLHQMDQIIAAKYVACQKCHLENLNRMKSSIENQAPPSFDFSICRIEKKNAKFVRELKNDLFWNEIDNRLSNEITYNFCGD